MADSSDLVEYLADQVAIGELTATYNKTFDGRQPVDWAATFTPDGALAVVGGPTIEGREALEELVRSAEISLFHVTTNAVIRIDGDTATQDVQLLVFVIADDRTSLSLLTSGRYLDQVVRTGDGWRFKLRTATMDIMPEPAAEAIEAD